MGIPRNNRPECIGRCPSHRCGKAASVESQCGGRTQKKTNYYEAPVHAKGTYAMESSHISFPSLLQVVLGSAYNSWGFDESDTAAVAEFICSVSYKCHDIRKNSPAWIHMLADASDAFSSSKGDARSLNHKLIALGRTRGPTPSAETRVPPVLGLTDMKSLMTLLKTPGYQLRLLYTNIRRPQFPKADPFDVILRYRVPVASRGILSLEHLEKAGFVVERELG